MLNNKTMKDIATDKVALGLEKIGKNFSKENIIFTDIFQINYLRSLLVLK